MTNLVNYCEVCNDFVENVYPIPGSCYTNKIEFGFIEQACLVCLDKHYDVLRPIFRKCSWCGELANQKELLSWYGKTFFHEDCLRKKKNFQIEKARVNSQNKRTSMLGFVSDLTTSEWIEILNKYNHKCAYCNGRFEEMEHVVPVSAGGGTTKNNVVPCCKSCNRKKRGQIWKPSLEMAISL